MSGDGPWLYKKKSSHTNASYSTSASKPAKDYVVAISKPLLKCPEFSCDTSEDGPDKYGDEKKPVIEESCSSDSVRKQ